MNSAEMKAWDEARGALEDWELFKRDFLDGMYLILHDEMNMPVPRVFIDMGSIAKIKVCLEEAFDDIFDGQRAAIKKVIEEYDSKDAREYEQQVKEDYDFQQMGG